MVSVGELGIVLAVIHSFIYFVIDNIIFMPPFNEVGVLIVLCRCMSG